jgi:hypothetical protein
MTVCTEMSGRRQAGRYRMSNQNTDRIDSTTPFDPWSWSDTPREARIFGTTAPRVVVTLPFLSCSRRR